MNFNPTSTSNNVTKLIPNMSYKKIQSFKSSPLNYNSINTIKNSLKTTLQNKGDNIVNSVIQDIFNTTKSYSVDNKCEEILPTIKWVKTSEVKLKSHIQNTEDKLQQEKQEEQEDREEQEEELPEKIGFIILRHVNSETTNEYWKECYRCIKYFYPKNRILIIDDNSDEKYVSNLVLDNTMIIKSEYPKRGEFLPYYYFLKTKFCDTAVILHDSVFIKKYINFSVNNYKMIWDFKKESISDPESFFSQKNMLLAIGSPKLIYFYSKKDSGFWEGCFGAMCSITYDYLKSIDSEYRISSLIPHITCRKDRCAFERIIACLIQLKYKEKSLLGSIYTYCKWGLTYDDYLVIKNKTHLPIVKVWTGR